MRTDFDPAAMPGMEFYGLLTAVIVPRPIAWVSSISAAGVDNLAPHSFFTVACVNPPIVQFTSVGRKDSLNNIEATGEFVVNLAGEKLFTQVNATGTDFPPETSEFDAVGIAREPALKVKPPRVADSPVALECVLHSTVGLGDSTIVLGRVVHAAIADEVMVDGRPQIQLLQPLSRLGGDEWGRRAQIDTLSRIRYADWPGHYNHTNDQGAVMTELNQPVEDHTDQNSLQNVSFASNSRVAHGYLALPESGTGPGVIVIQEWWGLDDHIAGIADRLAAEGFVALAPDLYGGRVAHDTDEAGTLMSQLPAEQAATDLAGAVDYLLGLDAVSSHTVGAIGFCMGGGFVLQLATQLGDKISAAVPFYGVGQAPEDYSNLSAAVQGHYGIEDSFYPAEDARAQEAKIRDESGAEVEFYYYSAGHAFHNDKDRMGTYDEGSAILAWGRSVEFLKAKIR